VPRAAQAHNEYVQVAAELGILGILFVVGFLGVGLVGLWRRLRRSSDESDQLDLLLFACGLVVFFIHALVSFPGHLPVSSMAIVLLVGLIFSGAYGDSATKALYVKKNVALVALAAMAIVGVVVSAFAISDLSANILEGAGTQQYQLSAAYQSIGDSRRSEDALKEAKRLLELSIRRDFAPRQSYFYLGAVLARLGEAEQALTMYEKCFTRFVDENMYAVYIELALQINQLEKARTAIEFLLSTNPKRPTAEQTRYQEASLAIQLGDYNGAVQLLEELVRDVPDYETGFIGLANLYQGLGRSEEAREVYEHVLEMIEGNLARVNRQIDRLTGRGDSITSSLTQQRSSYERQRAFVLEQLDVLSDS